MRPHLTFVCAAALVIAGLVPAAQAQAPIENTPIPMWVPDAYISDVVRVGNTLVVGGYFNYVGPPTGPFAIADAADASSFNTAARLLGAVQEILADGSGGWFVILDSTRGQSLPVLVRIAPDGTRDSQFVLPPNLFAVSSMAVDGGRVFVAGTFTIPGNPLAQPGLVALDKFTGALLPWTPASLPTGSGGLVASQGVLYVGYPAGASQTPSSLALDAATGAVLPFAVTGSVRSWLYSETASCVRTSSSSSATLTAYDRSGALVPAFAASYPTIGAVAASPTHVYAIVQPTGTGTSPTQIVALDATTGTAVWSSPTFDYGNGGPEALAPEGNTLFVGGHFTRVGDVARTRVAAFEATTGALLPWAPSIGGQLGVTSLAVAAGRVAIGGFFGSVGGIVKRGLVSLDLTTGRPSAVQPPDSNPVTALAASGDLVVAATYIYPAPAAPEVFAYSAATGTRYPKALGINGQVTSMGISGATLFLGGFFNNVDTELRRNLAAYDLVAGQLLPWNPSPDDGVHALKVHAGALYAVGRFRSLPGYGRGGAVAFDLGSLQVTSWNPQHGGLVVYDVDAWQDRVFIGVHVRDVVSPRTFRVMRTLAVDRFSGAPLNLDIPLGPEVAQVAGTLVVGGNGDFGGFEHPLAAFDGTSGQGIPWAPSVVSHFFSSGAELPQNNKLIGIDGYLVLTGSLSVGTLPVSNLAVFKPQIVLPGAPRQIQMTVTGSTVSLAWSPGAAPAPLGYVLEAGSAPGLSDLGRFPLGSATQVAAGVAPGSYALRVRAIGASGEGPASSEWLFTTPATSTPPSAPSGLGGSVAGNVVTLGWTAAAGNATTYVIEGGTAPGLSNLGVLATGSLDTSIAGAVPAGTYYLRMRAANAFGSSAPSNEIVLVVP